MDELLSSIASSAEGIGMPRDKAAKKKSKIIEASQLPETEKVYLKKDWTGWRVVEPIAKDADKPANFKTKEARENINWKRIITGTKRERAFIGFILFLGLIIWGAFHEQINNYNSVVNNPCAYCNSCQAYPNQYATAQNRDAGLNVTEVNLNLLGGNG